MAYTRKRWENGEVITATALNNIEDGIVELKEATTGFSNNLDTQKLNISGDLEISETTTTKNLSVTGNATFSGATFSGAVTINNGSLTVPTPNDESDEHAAASKGYVDGKENDLTSYMNKTFALKTTTIQAVNGLTVTNGGTLNDNTTLSLKTAGRDILGGIKVGTNLSIDSNGVLSAQDTTYSEATATTAGLMPAADRKKLEGIEKVGTVTGVQINGTVKEPNSGVVDLGTIITSQDISTKANLDSPKFSGVVNFGDQISIDANNNKITINQTDITEAQINALYNLPSIPTLPLNEAEGTYTLQAQKTGTNITYSWVLVGGE